MDRILSIVQIVLAAILVGAILMQAKGTGLTGVFGGEGNVYRTKRGAEKFLFLTTIVVAALFIGVAVWNLILQR